MRFPTGVAHGWRRRSNRTARAPARQTRGTAPGRGLSRIRRNVRDALSAHAAAVKIMGVAALGAFAREQAAAIRAHVPIDWTRARTRGHTCACRSNAPCAAMAIRPTGMRPPPSWSSIRRRRSPRHGSAPHPNHWQHNAPRHVRARAAPREPHHGALIGASPSAASKEPPSAHAIERAMVRRNGAKTA